MKRSWGVAQFLLESSVDWCLHQQVASFANLSHQPRCSCLFCLGLKLESDLEPRPLATRSAQDVSSRPLLFLALCDPHLCSPVAQGSHPVVNDSSSVA